MKKYNIHPRHRHLTLIEKLIDWPYPTLFFVWMTLILVFAVVYFLLSTFAPEQGLSVHLGNDPVRRLLNAFYFSSITSTTVGYGDIAPLGLSRIAAVIQSISSIVLSAIFISKLVTHKQEIALYQMHKLTFEELFSETREGFYIMRKDFEEIRTVLAQGEKMNDRLWSLLATALKQGQSLLEQILNFYDEDNHMYIIDIRREELLLESVHRTVERLVELMECLLQHHQHVMNAPQTLREYEGMVHSINNILPIWKQRSHYAEHHIFEKIEHYVPRMRRVVK